MERGDEGASPDPIWGQPMGDLGEPDDVVERTGGRLRRRAAEARRQVTGETSLATSSPAPPLREDAGDLWGVLAGITQRIEVLSDATVALRADMDKSLADIAGVVTTGQDQTTRDVSETFARSLASTRSELNARFQDDLERVTTTMSDALAQVAAHLERLNLVYGDNRDALDNATKAIKATSRRLEDLQPSPAPDLTSLTDAVTQVADLVESLARRVG